MMVEHVSGAVLQLTGAAFAGICVYIALVQHPVRLGLTPAAALDDFRAVIPRAEKLQAPLLIVCLLAIAVHLAAARSWPVAVGGLLLLVVLVLTVASVLPINRRLLSGTLRDHLAQSEHALTRWGRLHTLRTVLTVIGAITLWL